MMARSFLVLSVAASLAAATQDNGCESVGDNVVELEDVDTQFYDPSDPYEGEGIRLVGDLNGDGIEDIVAGAYASDAGGSMQGAAFVYYGPVEGRINVESDADATIIGEGAWDAFGHYPAAAGDFNGDGYDDLVLGAMYNDRAGENAGAAYIFFGGHELDGVMDATQADVVLLGEGADDFTGWAVAGAGDVDGDGFDDVLISTYGGPLGTGGAYLVRGGPSVSGTLSLSDADAFYGLEPADMLKLDISGAGDVNGDGFADFLIGASDAHDYAGAAYLVYGPVQGTHSVTEADLVVVGEGASRLGDAVAGVGDVNGDGFDDILLGASAYVDASGMLVGGAFLYYGGDLGGALGIGDADVTFTGTEYKGHTGRHLAGVGDWNGDGYADFAVSAQDEWNGEGAVYLVYGGALPTELDRTGADIVYRAPSSGAIHVGWAIAGTSAVDGRFPLSFVIGALGAGMTQPVGYLVR